MVVLIAVLLALLAGALTTLAGMGGGLVLTLGLAALVDPVVALAATGPGLLAGNVHRAWMYRTRIVGRVTRMFILGAVPGALIGGMVATIAPEQWVRVGMVGIAVLATAKTISGLGPRLPAAALLPGGATAGFVSATAGGGGLVAAPMLLATGLSGRSYVATGAAGASSVHVARMAGYGAGGALDAEILALGALLAVCIPLGNVLGDRLRRFVPKAWVPRLEVGVVVTGLGLALVGLR